MEKLGQGCTVPPEGWYCTREPLHEGPCAALPIPTRPSKEEMFLRIAEVVATRSTCSRLSVGAVVTDWEMTTAKSLGYNGNARGLPNGCDTTVPGACGCLHAEDNALLKAPYENTGPLVLFCTHNPCVTCAKRILNTRVLKVIYRHEYRNMDGVYLMRQHGVTVKHLAPPTPKWEYRVTDGPRKAWDEQPNLSTEGWERDPTIGQDGWERHDNHETITWRRRTVVTLNDG